MTWINDIETVVFTIITGDGKTYTPKWKNARKEIEYNASIFEFVEIEGSLVIRKKAKGRRFELEFYFDGENAVSLGNNFEISARNNKNWKVKHPFYGDLTCQPVALKQDDSIYNVSRFNITAIETITDKYPKYTEVIPDKIEEQLVNTNTNQAEAFQNSGELDKNELLDNVESFDTTFSKIIDTDEELLEFKNLVSDAVIEINSSVSDANSILVSMQQLINYPATIIQTIEARFDAFRESFDNLVNSFTNNKNQFEAVAGGIIAAMNLSSALNINDSYETRSKVVVQQDQLSQVYSEYIKFLDSQQTERADSENSYIPNYSGINSLNTLVNLAISNLYIIAFEAKQEREYILQDDNNVINLTHRFYGLDKNDVNLNKFISINNIGLSELLNIKKGRKIIYYV